MTKDLVSNITIIILLVTAISAVWVFNQKVNYRKVFDINSKFSLKSDKNDPEFISSVYYFYDAFKTKGYITSLVPTMNVATDFTVIGRTLLIDGQELIIYEYASNKYAIKDFEKISSIYGQNLYVYKNLIVLNKSDDSKIRQELFNLITKPE